MKINPLKTWLDNANAEQKRMLSGLMKTSLPYVYHMASGYRKITPVYAIKIEQATRKMNEKFGTPIIYQYQICKVCQNCPYAK